MLQSYLNAKYKYALLFILLLVLFLLLLLYFAYIETRHNLKVVFLDVGQGDAIFVETPSGKQVLIDAGPDESVLYALEQQMPYLDKSLDLIMATHSDKDHIGGLPYVLKSYKAEYFYDPSLKNKKSRSAESLLNLLARDKNKNVKELSLKRGDVLDFQDGVKIIVYWPSARYPFSNSNSDSLAIKILYGNNSFFLDGDLPSYLEDILAMKDKRKLKSSVLKFAHHGSASSSSLLFLKTLSPEYAVVSAGKDNNYGHPSKAVLERAKDENIQVFDTRKNGWIYFESDGDLIHVKTER